VVLFIVLCKVVLPMKSFLSVTIQMKAIERYFPVVLIVMLYKVDLIFESLDENLKLRSTLKRSRLFCVDWFSYKFHVEIKIKIT